MQTLPVGERLNEYMLLRGYTPQTLSEALGISKRALTDILRGRRFPKGRLFIKIRNVLDVRIDYLLGRSDKSE